jgi:hypothetical protein
MDHERVVGIGFIVVVAIVIVSIASYVQNNILFYVFLGLVLNMIYRDVYGVRYVS